jgi:hypothetical protein
LGTAVKKPFMAPATYPTAAPANIATTGGIPAFESNTEMTPVNAKVEPTDKSMPPVNITRVIPAARMAVIELCFNTFKILLESVKFGAKTIIMIINRARMINMPS